MNGTNSQWSYALQIGGLQTNQDYSLFLQYSQWAEGSKLNKNWSKFSETFVKKRLGRALERGARAQMGPGYA